MELFFMFVLGIFDVLWFFFILVVVVFFNLCFFYLFDMIMYVRFIIIGICKEVEIFSYYICL